MVAVALRRLPRTGAALVAATAVALLAGSPASAGTSGADPAYTGSAATGVPTAVRVAGPELPGLAQHWLQLAVRGQTPTGEPLLVDSTASGYTPAQVRSYLGLTGNGAGQTIAVVTAFDAPNAARDLAVFNSTFGLPAPPSFRKVNQSGGTKYPKANAGWALEAALDVQWAHAVAPAANILLVEASSNTITNMMTALTYAAKQPGVTVISGSFGFKEYSGQVDQDYRCRLTTGACVFASGDTGNPGRWPATNPAALAVGGTSLTLDSAGGVTSEVAWSGSGGGVSAYAARPAYQSAVTAATRRTTPDVSYAGDPATGFAVYSSTPYDGQSGWFQMGGTSAGAPQWAGVLAAANQLRKAAGKGVLAATNRTGGTPLHSALYQSGRLGDVVTGSNGTCGPLCAAAPGFDAVTGLGSPRRGLDVVLRDAA